MTVWPTVVNFCFAIQSGYVHAQPFKTMGSLQFWKKLLFFMRNLIRLFKCDWSHLYCISQWLFPKIYILNVFFCFVFCIKVDFGWRLLWKTLKYSCFSFSCKNTEASFHHRPFQFGSSDSYFIPFHQHVYETLFFIQVHFYSRGMYDVVMKWYCAQNYY